MNVLTSPLVPIKVKGEPSRISFQDILLRRYEQGHTCLAPAHVFQELALAMLLTNMAAEMVEAYGGNSLSDLTTQQIEKWILEHASSFEVFNGKTRFMQHPFRNAESKISINAFQVLNTDVPGDSTSNPFHRKNPLQDSAYCPHCATIDLYGFHNFAPGAGKPTGGMHLHGTNVLIPKDDPWEYIEANMAVSPKYSGEPSEYPVLLQELAGKSISPVYPWENPEYTKLLENETPKIKDTKHPLVNYRNFRFWMPRQVWLTTEQLAKPRPCISCGGFTDIHVTIQDGSEKKDPTKEKGPKKDKDKNPPGALSFPPGFLSHTKPFHLAKDPKTKVETQKTFTLDTLDRLLSVSSFFLEGHPSIPVRKNPDLVALRVIAINTNTSAFDKALVAEIPIVESKANTITILQRMANAADNQRKALYGALAGFFHPRDAKKHVPMQNALASFDIFIGSFPFYMADSDVSRWKQELLREARRLFQDAVGHNVFGIRKTDTDADGINVMQLFTACYYKLSPKA